MSKRAVLFNSLNDFARAGALVAYPIRERLSINYYWCTLPKNAISTPTAAFHQELRICLPACFVNCVRVRAREFQVILNYKPGTIENKATAHLKTVLRRESGLLNASALFTRLIRAYK